MRSHPLDSRGHSSAIRAALCGVFFVFVGTPGFTSVEAQSNFYQVIDLGLHTPSEINLQEQVAITTQQGVAAVWDQGIVRHLSIPPGFERGGATGLNDRAQIVGFVVEKPICLSGPGCPAPPRRAVRWDAAGTIAILPKLPAAGSRAESVFNHAEAVNNSGEIVGSAGDGLDISRGGWQKAVMWRNGEIIEVGPPRAAGSARSINDVGEVVGWAQLTPTDNPGPIHAFIWSDGEMIDLGTLTGPAGFSYANDINGARQIVGVSLVPDGNRHAFLAQTAMIDLGALPGDADSEAFAINRWGDIVGISYDDSCACPRRAVLWRDGAAIDLNTMIDRSSGWVLEEALDINDEGRIVGRGRLNGEQRFFVLEPLSTPPPDSDGDLVRHHRRGA